jgi:hypothetical protein
LLAAAALLAPEAFVGPEDPPRAAVLAAPALDDPRGPAVDGVEVAPGVDLLAAWVNRDFGSENVSADVAVPASHATLPPLTTVHFVPLTRTTVAG